MSTRILVVDDGPSIVEMLTLLPKPGGLEVSMCATDNNALPLFRVDRLGLVLLDAMLPGLDGVPVCRLIEEESDVPIIMMSARTDSVDVIADPEAGVDDYVIKLFENSMLLTRVRAHLRRQEPEYKVLHVSDLIIDLRAHQVQRTDKILHLTPLEFELLSVLACKSWQVFSRGELLEQVWGYRQSFRDPRVINVHMQRLRLKVKHSPDYPEVVLIVRGVGYRAGMTQE